MSNSSEVENASNDDLLQKSKRKFDQESGEETERLYKATLNVLEGFINRLVMEPTGVTMETKGRKRCPQGENQDYLFHKQKKQKTRKNNTEKKKKSNPNPKMAQAETNQKFADLGLEPPPDMPESFKICIGDMGGTEIKLIIQKFIRVTDLDPQQNRMSMPLKQVRCEFLNDVEKEKLSRREAIQVVFVDPHVLVSELKLNKWDVGKTSSSYVLNGPWHKNVVKNNEDSLKPMAVVQIWSFRVEANSKLGFALVKVRDEEQD